MADKPCPVCGADDHVYCEVEKKRTGCVHRWRMIALGTRENDPDWFSYRYTCELCPKTWEGRDPRKLPKQAAR